MDSIYKINIDIEQILNKGCNFLKTVKEDEINEDMFLNYILNVKNKIELQRKIIEKIIHKDSNNNDSTQLQSKITRNNENLSLVLEISNLEEKGENKRLKWEINALVKVKEILKERL